MQATEHGMAQNIMSMNIRLRATICSSILALISLMVISRVNAQSGRQPAAPLEVETKAIQLADKVYLESANLALLQLFYTTRDAKRESEVQKNINSARTMLTRLEADVKGKVQAGKLSAKVVGTVESARMAADAVIVEQAGLAAYRDEPADIELTGQSKVQLLQKLYGQLPGPPRTPEFYLGLLTWARYGWPKTQFKLDVRPAPQTLVEAHQRKLEQLTNPGRFDGVSPAAIPLPANTLLDTNRRKPLDGRTDFNRSAIERTR